MAYPVYVLLPADAEWTPIAGTVAQSPAPVRWYLRQAMPEATTQVAVLVASEEPDVGRRIGEIARRAEALGGIAMEGDTQRVIDPASGVPIA